MSSRLPGLVSPLEMSKVSPFFHIFSWMVSTRKRKLLHLKSVSLGTLVGWIWKSLRWQQIDRKVLVANHLRPVALTGFSGRLWWSKQDRSMLHEICVFCMWHNVPEKSRATSPSNAPCKAVRFRQLQTRWRTTGLDGPQMTHWSTLKTWALERMTSPSKSSSDQFPGVPCILDASRIGFSSHSVYQKDLLDCLIHIIVDMPILDTAILGIILYHFLTSWLDRSRGNRSWALSELSSELEHQCDREASELVIWRVSVGHLMDRLPAPGRHYTTASARCGSLIYDV